jgi:hypothetical protein
LITQLFAFRKKLDRNRKEWLMVGESKHQSATEAMLRINREWLSSHIEDLRMVHPEIVMVFPVLRVGYRDGKNFSLGSGTSASTPEFMNSANMIVKSTSPVTPPWSLFGTRWSTSVLANDSLQPAGINGCSGTKIALGFPSGGQCLTCRRTLRDDGINVTSIAAKSGRIPTRLRTPIREPRGRW